MIWKIINSIHKNNMQLTFFFLKSSYFPKQEMKDNTLNFILRAKILGTLMLWCNEHVMKPTPAPLPSNSLCVLTTQPFGFKFGNCIKLEAHSNFLFQVLSPVFYFLFHPRKDETSHSRETMDVWCHVHTLEFLFCCWEYYKGKIT